MSDETPLDEEAPAESAAAGYAVPPPLPPVTPVPDRPELPVAAAFAGGFVLALLLKRLAR